MTKIAIINANLHRVYWGWYRFLAEYYGAENIYLIFPENNGQTILKKELKESLSITNIIGLSYKTYFKRFIFLDNLKEALKKINPDIIFPKIVFEPYSLDALNFAENYNKDILFFDELKDIINNILLKTSFEFYLQKFIKRKVNYRPVIGVTRDSFKYLSKLGFNSYYIPYSYWKDEYILKEHPQDKLRLLFVGNLNHVKNLGFVIRTIYFMIKKGRISKQDIEFTIVGDGYLKKELLNLVKKLNLLDIVKFLGYIENRKLNDVYSQHNLFILPSIKEAVGLVVLEAMYNSLPVLVSSNAGASSYLLDFYNGLTFDPKNSNSLSFALEYYLDSNIREKHGKNSFNLMKESFDYKKIGKKLIKLIGGGLSE